jgi:hypothetical protein
MLSSVLRSRQAIQVNIGIMRAFMRLRETLSLHKELAGRLAVLERKIESHDESIRTLFEAIRRRHRLTSWVDWPIALRKRRPAALIDHSYPPYVLVKLEQLAD